MNMHVMLALEGFSNKAPSIEGERGSAQDILHRDFGLLPLSLLGCLPSDHAQQYLSTFQGFKSLPMLPSSILPSLLLFSS